MLANLHIEWARLLLGSLVQAGVERVILSPGARSTPLVVAALRIPGLKIVDVLDERSAAFVALGSARATGQPALLVCTSGTAGAHYLPAVIEARYAGVPLLVLTADRPPELQEREAPQTIDQRHFFGHHVLASIDLGVPDADPRAFAGLRYTALRAVATAKGPPPGPVHLNAAFRKPLEPQPVQAGDADVRHRADQLLAAPIPTVAAGILQPDVGLADRIAEACRKGQRGLVVAGPAALAQQSARPAVHELCRLTGFTLLAEATSQLGGQSAPGVACCGGFDAVLQSGFVDGLDSPEIIVQLGSPPISAAWTRWIEKHAGRGSHFVIARSGLRDPSNSASGFLAADVADGVQGLVERLLTTPRHVAAPNAWSDAWLAGQARLIEVLHTRVDGVDAASYPQGRAVRETLRALPPDGMFMVGNSLAVRLLDAFASDLVGDHVVLSQRGASGIDGLVSGAVGAALATHRPMTLLLGDVAFLHDLQGLASARRVTTPMAVVVLNNDGGRIFEQLPMASLPDLRSAIEQHWVMPHGLNMKAAAELFGLDYVVVDDPSTLGGHLAAAHDQAGCTVLEVSVADAGAVPELWRLWSAMRR